jgi:hypothetical protein
VTPTDEPGRNGPRLRARAKTGAPDALRPEVASALGGLERSIGELTEWEHLLAGAPGDEAAGGAVAPPTPADLVLLAHVTPGADEPAEEETADQSGLDLGLPASALAGAVAAEPFVEPNLDLSPLFTHEGDEADGIGPIPETIVPSATYGPGGPDPRRRRNGRILSWAGAIILVAVAALWLLPSRGGSNNPTTRDTTTTTPEPTTTRVTLGGATFPTLPTTTLPVTPSVTAPAVIPTTPTTARKATTKPKTTTTATTVAPTTTAAPTTTTTVRPTTTTTISPPITCAPGGEPDPVHGTC